MDTRTRTCTHNTYSARVREREETDRQAGRPGGRPADRSRAAAALWTLLLLDPTSSAAGSRRAAHPPPAARRAAPARPAAALAAPSPPATVTGWVRIQLVDVIKTRLISILMGATNAASRGGHRALAIPQSFLNTRSSTPSDPNPACDSESARSRRVRSGKMTGAGLRSVAWASVITLVESSVITLPVRCKRWTDVLRRPALPRLFYPHGRIWSRADSA